MARITVGTVRNAGEEVPRDYLAAVRDAGLAQHTRSPARYVRHFEHYAGQMLCRRKIAASSVPCPPMSAMTHIPAKS